MKKVLTLNLLVATLFTNTGVLLNLFGDKGITPQTINLIVILLGLGWTVLTVLKIYRFKKYLRENGIEM